MIAALARYKLVAEGLVALALLAAILYGFHAFCEYQQKIGSDRKQAEWNLDTANREAADAKLALDREKQSNLATQQGAEREKTIAAAFASNAAAVVSLRNANASYQAQLATADLETNRRFAAAASAVSSECAAEYNAVAKDAARLDNAARTLNDAWPQK
jgi:hypothetical protein